MKHYRAGDNSELLKCFGRKIWKKKTLESLGEISSHILKLILYKYNEELENGFKCLKRNFSCF